MHDRIREYWDEDAHTYDETRSHAISDRLEATAWRQALADALPEPGSTVLDVRSGLRSTLILLVSTAFVWRARAGGERTRTALLVGIAGAVRFLVSKSLEWRHELAAGLLPSTSTFLAMYYTLTGLHAAHVAGGLVANLWSLSGMRHVGAAMTAGRMHALSLYWAFVDLVWIMVFTFVYLV